MRACERAEAFKLLKYYLGSVFRCSLKCMRSNHENFNFPLEQIKYLIAAMPILYLNYYICSSESGSALHFNNHHSPSSTGVGVECVCWGGGGGGR